MRQARSTALADSEIRRLQRVMAAAVAGVRPGMSHPDDHAYTLSNMA